MDIRAADAGRYAAVIDDRVAMKIGPGDWSPGAGWHVAADGEGFALWGQFHEQVTVPATFSPWARRFRF